MLADAKCKTIMTNPSTPPLASGETPARPVQPRLAKTPLPIYLAIWLGVILEGVLFYVGGVRTNSALFALAMPVLALCSISTAVNNFAVITNSPLLFLGGYTLFAFASAGWSYVEFESIFQIVPIIAVLILAIGQANVPSRVTQRAIVTAGIWTATLSFVVAFVSPAIGANTSYLWRLNGIMGHPQRLALFMCICLIVWFGSYLKGDRLFLGTWLPRLGSVVIIAALAATQARAFTIFFVVTIGCMYLLRVRGSRWLSLLVLALCVVAAFLMQDYLFELLSRDESNDATLSGRTTIWAGTIELILARPWFGYGFASFPTDLTSHFFQNFVAPHAHNEILMAAMETGWLGASLLALFLVSAFWLCFTNWRHFSVSGALFIFALMSGLTGVVFSGKASFPSMLIVLVFAQEFQEWQSARRERRRQQAS